MKPEFYTSDGHLTRYALACGYTERKGSLRLEQICSNGALKVYNVETHEVTYLGPNLKEARKALAKGKY